ncbi:MAG: LPS export ABC transporter periplasmic protein LptC [Deltaproteobacteria bacterium]|nr:LPS export ABC transporter periplasmic protein LptC [Deltaproteobacteria bacterium]
MKGRVIKNLYIFNENGIILAMKPKIKLILAIFLISAVSVIGVALYINSTMHKGLSGAVAKSSPADIRIEKARYAESRDGQKEWELEADSAQYFKSDNLTVFENVKVVFYSENGINYTLEGKTGKLRNDTKDMDIFGNVVVTSADGYQLKTDSLKYTAIVKQISTKDKVVFTGPNIRIDGVGFLADMVTERASVLANVRTVLKDAAI